MADTLEPELEEYFNDEMFGFMHTRSTRASASDERRRELMKETAYLRGTRIQYIDHFVTVGSNKVGAFIATLLRFVIMTPVIIAGMICNLVLWCFNKARNFADWYFSDIKDTKPPLTPLTPFTPFTPFVIYEDRAPAGAPQPCDHPFLGLKRPNPNPFIEQNGGIILEEHYLEEAYQFGKPRPRPRNVTKAESPQDQSSKE